MPAPTLVTTCQIVWGQTANILIGNATLNYSATVATQAGDLIVGLQGSEDQATSGTITLTDGTNSYTSRTQEANGSHCGLNISSATDTAGSGSRQLTFNRSLSATDKRVGGWGLIFRNHGGVGNVIVCTDGVQTGNLTCSANSSVAVICLDWGAVAGARTWATINGNAPTQTNGVDGDASHWAAALAYWANVGASGSKTITLSTPTYGTPNFAAIEILGTAGTSNAIAWVKA
jgi:hypothetical protein